MTKGKLVLWVIGISWVLFEIIYWVRFGNPLTNSFNGFGTMFAFVSGVLFGCACVVFLLYHIVSYIFNHWDDKL